MPSYMRLTFDYVIAKKFDFFGIMSSKTFV
jgi:hypothetical protein